MILLEFFYVCCRFGHTCEFCFDTSQGSQRFRHAFLLPFSVSGIYNYTKSTFFKKCMLVTGGDVMTVDEVQHE